MSENGDELSDDEYAALLRELEGRASGSEKSGDKKKKNSRKKAPVEDDAEVEDIDAFLKSLEEDADSGSSTATDTRSAEDDDLANEFAALEAIGELVAPPEEKKKDKKKKKAEKKKKKKGAKKEKAPKSGADGEESRGKRVAIFLAHNTLWFLPAIILWWVLGAYLGNWVSAGWLIALVSTMFVFGTPAILKKVARRGTYRPWLLGSSLLLTVALIAPMPDTAGQNMAQYGHWTTSAVAEVFGWAPDAGIVTTHAAVSGWLGGVVAIEEAPNWSARQLGTVYALDMERPAEPAGVDQGQEGIEEPTPGEPDPGGATEGEAQPGEAQPAEAEPAEAEGVDPVD